MIVPEFQHFTAEGQIIGRLLAGYGSLESALSSCVAMGINNLDVAIKVMFRARGETQRIEVADALARPSYHALGMGPIFNEAIADMRYCLKIRNQFAHCHWHDDRTGNLCFVDMEELAKQNRRIADFSDLTFHYVTLQILRQQEAYFKYVANSFLYLNYEGRKKAGTIPMHAVLNPEKLDRPPRYLLQEAPSPCLQLGEKG